NVKCNVCGWRHVTIMHRDRPVSSALQSSSSDSALAQPAIVNPRPINGNVASNPNQTPSSTSIMTSRLQPASSNTVVLQTVKVIALNEEKSAPARMMFDTGSHRTYISAKL